MQVDSKSHTILRLAGAEPYDSAAVRRAKPLVDASASELQRLLVAHSSLTTPKCLETTSLSVQRHPATAGGEQYHSAAGRSQTVRPHNRAPRQAAGGRKRVRAAAAAGCARCAQGGARAGARAAAGDSLSARRTGGVVKAPNSGSGSGCGCGGGDRGGAHDGCWRRTTCARRRSWRSTRGSWCCIPRTLLRRSRESPQRQRAAAAAEAVTAAADGCWRRTTCRRRRSRRSMRLSRIAVGACGASGVMTRFAVEWKQQALRF